jgi:hypothetical protein
VLTGDHRAACHYAEDALQSDVGVAHLAPDQRRTRIPPVVRDPATGVPVGVATTTQAAAVSSPTGDVATDGAGTDEEATEG